MPSTTRWVVYLGTRGCLGVLEDSLRDYFGKLRVLVPAEARLLGPRLRDRDLSAGLRALAQLLEDRARTRASTIADRNEEALTSVFGKASDPRERIETSVVEAPIEDAIADRASSETVEDCYVARDALDVLGSAGIRLGDPLDAHGIDLVTR